MCIQQIQQIGCEDNYVLIIFLKIMNELFFKLKKLLIWIKDKSNVLL